MQVEARFTSVHGSICISPASSNDLIHHCGQSWSWTLISFENSEIRESACVHTHAMINDADFQSSLAHLYWCPWQWLGFFPFLFFLMREMKSNSNEPNRWMNKLKKRICETVNENYTHASPISWCSQQHKSQSGLSNASKDTVTMTTRDHSRHEWLEEGSEAKL